MLKRKVNNAKWSAIFMISFTGSEKNECQFEKNKIIKKKNRKGMKIEEKIEGWRDKT